MLYCNLSFQPGFTVAHIVYVLFILLCALQLWKKHNPPSSILEAHVPTRAEQTWMPWILVIFGKTKLNPTVQTSDKTKCSASVLLTVVFFVASWSTKMPTRPTEADCQVVPCGGAQFAQLISSESLAMVPGLSWVAGYIIERNTSFLKVHWMWIFWQTSDMSLLYICLP